MKEIEAIMTDFLDLKHEEIKARLGELKPAVEEYERLEAALAALAAVSPAKAQGNGQAHPVARVKVKRERAAKPSVAGEAAKRTRGRPRGSGKRDVEALRIITETPGLKVAEIAAKMGLVQPNYLYKLLPKLPGVESRDGSWYPKAPSV